MGNEVAAQQGTTGLSFAVPSHLQAQMTAAGGGNLGVGGDQTNKLLIKGMTWTMSINGEKKPITIEIDGEIVPKPVLRAVILDQSVRGRVLNHEWDDEPKPPICWSADGRKPHASVQDPKAKSCDLCPMSVKGSGKPYNGEPTVACKGQKFLALLPVNDKNQIGYSFPPLRLKLAPTAIWDDNDKEAQAQGWYAWDNLVKFLKANGVGYSNAMVVRMRFAPGKNSQIQFARGDFLELDDFNKTLAIAQSEDVQKLLSYNPQATEGSYGSKSTAKPLPQDEPAGDPVFSQSGASAQAAQEQENARLKTEAYEADLARLAQEAEAKKTQAAAEAAQAKVAADKADKIAAAKRLLAEAEAEAEAARGFDEPEPAPNPVVSAPAPVKETAPPARKPRAAKAAEPAPPTQIPELPTTPAMDEILSWWDKESAPT